MDAQCVLHVEVTGCGGVVAGSNRKCVRAAGKGQRVDATIAGDLRFGVRRSDRRTQPATRRIHADSGLRR